MSAEISSIFIRSPNESSRTITFILSCTSRRSDNPSTTFLNRVRSIPYMARLSSSDSCAGRSHQSAFFCPISRLNCLFISLRRSHGTKPSTRALPDVGFSKPESILSTVVLPAPFGPRKPTNSPSSILKETWSAARVSSYRRLIRPLIEPQRPRSFRYVR